jgi:hypothetical protein
LESLAEAAKEEREILTREVWWNTGKATMVRMEKEEEGIVACVLGKSRYLS